MKKKINKIKFKFSVLRKSNLSKKVSVLSFLNMIEIIGIINEKLKNSKQTVTKRRKIFRVLRKFNICFKFFKIQLAEKFFYFLF